MLVSLVTIRMMAVQVAHKVVIEPHTSHSWLCLRRTRRPSFDGTVSMLAAARGQPEEDQCGTTPGP